VSDNCRPVTVVICLNNAKIDKIRMNEYRKDERSYRNDEVESPT